MGDASSIPKDTAECAVPLASVHVNRKVTPPVPGVAHAVPVSMKSNCTSYCPAWLQAPAEAAQRVAVLTAAVRSPLSIGVGCTRASCPAVDDPAVAAENSCVFAFPQMKDDAE